MKLYETKFGNVNLAMLNFLFKIAISQQFINDERSE